MKRLMPTTPADWLSEMTIAFEEYEFLRRFGRLQGMSPAKLRPFQRAVEVCLDFRGRTLSEAEARRVAQGATLGEGVEPVGDRIGHHLEEDFQMVFQGFVVCYLLAHWILGLLSEQQMESILTWAQLALRIAQVVVAHGLPWTVLARKRATSAVGWK